MADLFNDDERWVGTPEKSEISTYLLEIHADLKSMNRILSSLCFGTGMAALFTMIIAVLWMIDHAS